MHTRRTGADDHPVKLMLGYSLLDSCLTGITAGKLIVLNVNYLTVSATSEIFTAPAMLLPQWQRKTPILAMPYSPLDPYA